MKTIEDPVPKAAAEKERRENRNLYVSAGIFGAIVFIGIIWAIIAPDFFFNGKIF